jgi:hypothetical protein
MEVLMGKSTVNKGFNWNIHHKWRFNGEVHRYVYRRAVYQPQKGTTVAKSSDHMWRLMEGKGN